MVAFPTVEPKRATATAAPNAAVSAIGAALLLCWVGAIILAAALGGWVALGVSLIASGVLLFFYTIRRAARRLRQRWSDYQSNRPHFNS